MLAAIDTDAIGPLRILADGSDGMAGPMVGPLLERLNLDVTTSRWEPNGDFPEAGPNPFLEENRRMLVEQVKKQGVDLAIAWDGDADRCFFIDDRRKLLRRRLRLRAARPRHAGQGAGRD